MNPFWKIYFLAVIGQSFLVIDGYLLNPGMRHTGTLGRAVTVSPSPFRSCARAQATRGHPGQGDFSHLAYHTHAPVGMLQVIGTPSFSPLAQVTSGNLAYHQAHRMTVAGVTVGLGDAVTERQGSPSFSPTVRRSGGGG